ncbi:MAG: hypothetical protein E6J72_20600 [Deltaproteobacteria bacterium]|nr:MAG: hypothetical protein E6J72_20600 [Deltaproteobacteria bacterium]
MSTTSVAEARALFGDAMLAPEDVARVFGTTAERLGDRSLLAHVPYDLPTLRAAHARGHLLVFRTPNDGAAPLTVMRFVERFPGAIQAKLLKGVGYLLKDEWTLDQEPFAAHDRCRLAWRLVHRESIAETRNLSYALQDAALARYAESAGLADARRRSGVAMVYDTLLFARAHGVKLLEHAWDWSDTPTADGGFVTAGELSADGLRVLGYSRAVRFGTLGICAEY